MGILQPLSHIEVFDDQADSVLLDELAEGSVREGEDGARAAIEVLIIQEKTYDIRKEVRNIIVELLETPFSL
jgi:hypothetical protein